MADFEDPSYSHEEDEEKLWNGRSCSNVVVEDTI